VLRNEISYEKLMCLFAQSKGAAGNLQSSGNKSKPSSSVHPTTKVAPPIDKSQVMSKYGVQPAKFNAQQQQQQQQQQQPTTTTTPSNGADLSQMLTGLSNTGGLTAALSGLQQSLATNSQLSSLLGALDPNAIANISAQQPQQQQHVLNSLSLLLFFGVYLFCLV